MIPGYWEDDGYDVDGWVGRSNGRDDAADVVTRATDARRARALPRFDRAERVVHWCNATLFLILLAHRRVAVRRAAVDVRRRAAHSVKTIHVYAGLLLPIPVLLGARAARRAAAARATSAGSTAGPTTTGAGGRGARARARSSASSIPVRS